jgi:hypothetical protein
MKVTPRNKAQVWSELGGGSMKVVRESGLEMVR